MAASENTASSALVRLRGHRSVPARLSVERVPPWLRASRIAAFATAWLVGSWGTLVLTFDPFVASFPFAIGLGFLYRAARGRYTVVEFAAGCPRCAAPLKLDAGSRIPLPYEMNCYTCHHEPVLVVERVDPSAPAPTSGAGVYAGAPPRITVSTAAA